MAKKISITGKPARQIEVTGKPYRRIEPEEFARALGAEAVNDSHAPNLDPLSLAVLGSANMADGVGIAYLRNNALALADEIDRLRAELDRVTAERDAARRALEALNKCPLSCQWVLCTECEAALIAALPEKP